MYVLGDCKCHWVNNEDEQLQAHDLHFMQGINDMHDAGPHTDKSWSLLVC